MLRDFPTWFIIAAVVMLFVGIGTTVFVVSKCGAKGLLFGNGAFMVAASGMCDE